MRPFYTTLVTLGLVLAAVSVSATSTVPTAVNVKSIPRVWLSQKAFSDPPQYKLYSDSGAVPTGYSAIPVAARWNASQADLGWDYLELKYHPDAPGSGNSGGWDDKLYHFGVMEGMVTAERIKYTVGTNLQTLGAATKQWMVDHINHMSNQVTKNPGSKFWKQVGQVLNQVKGIAAGYNTVTPGANVTAFDIFQVNFGPEIGDVEIALKVQAGKLSKDTLLPPRQVGSHCSALIKPTADDLFVAHDTWDVYSGMSHRIYKSYGFGSHSRTITFSSYPATVASGDDWYQIHDHRSTDPDIQLAVQETTNEVFNTSLYTAVVPQTVSEFIRVMAANYLATGAEDWTRYFSIENSGTYNNQYMVVDFAKYAPSSGFLVDTFWIAEQIPGMVARGDVSKVVREQGYWASYNIPYFKTIFDRSGYAQMVEEQGSFWSYDKYARPEIFKRNNTDVKDIAGMMKMMRYNNWKHDALSLIPNCTGATNNVCNPDTHSSMLTIASRGDLMKSYPTKAEMIAHYGPLYDFVAQGCFGAIDSKIASWKNRNSMNSYAVSGPTNDQQPTFSYGGAHCPNTPAGSPTTFDFPWLELLNDNGRSD